jgi:DNA-directed RNA polymerase specialized sigma24 family protein
MMNGGKIMDKPLVTITYKTADGKRIRLEVSIEVKELLEQSDRRSRSQGRQERRCHTEYVEGLTDTTTVLPQEDFADLIYRMDSYNRLYAAMETLSAVQQRRVLLHYFCGFSYRRIAVIEGVSPAAVSQSVAQARKALGKLLNK